MGNWAVIITGVGSHDNGCHFDIEELAKKVVKDFQDGGHTVASAVTVAGGKHDVLAEIEAKKGDGR